MNKPDGFIVEGYARQLVPESRLGGGWRIFCIVAGALCGPSIYFLAAHIGRGLGLTQAFFAFLVGAAVSGTLGACSAYLGASTRMNVAMLSDEAFGYYGGRLVKRVIAISLIGWVGVILSILGATASSAIETLFHVSIESKWIAIVAAAAVTILTLRGVDGLKYIGMLVAPLLAILLGLTLSMNCPVGSAFPARAPNAITFGAAVSSVVGAYIVGIVIQPDYGRYVRRPKSAFLGTGAALGLAFPCVLILSAAAPLRCSAPDLTTVLVSMGLGLPGLLLIILGTATDAAACLYSGSLSLTNDIKGFQLPWVTLGAAASGCVLAIFHAEKQFIPFLTFLGVFFPPVAAVNILHVTLASRSGFAELSSSKLAVRWPAFIAWSGGSLVGYLSSRGFVKILGIASLDSILVTAVLWLSLLSLIRRKSVTRSG